MHIYGWVLLFLFFALLLGLTIGLKRPNSIRRAVTTALVYVFVAYIPVSGIITLPETILWIVENYVIELFAQKWFGPIALFLGIFLFRLRGQYPAVYGAIEVIFSWLAILYSFSNIENKAVHFVSVAAGIYVTVRGLDNFEKGVPRFWKKKWHKTFPKRPPDPPDPPDLLTILSGRADSLVSLADSLRCLPIGNPAADRAINQAVWGFDDPPPYTTDELEAVMLLPDGFELLERLQCEGGVYVAVRRASADSGPAHPLKEQWGATFALAMTGAALQARAEVIREQLTKPAKLERDAAAVDALVLVARARSALLGR